MTNQTVVIGGGHNGLVCATYLAKAGHKVLLLEARDQLGGPASTTEFAEGFKSSVAHVLHSLNNKVATDLQLGQAGLERGEAVNTIALSADGNHLTLAKNVVSGNGLSESDLATYANFKSDFQAYAKALEPLTMNKPPRLKDMDTQDKFTLGKLGFKLRFGLGKDNMREFLRVGGINIYDVLKDSFESEALMGAIAFDAVMGHHMGPRTPNTVLSYLNHVRGEIYGDQSIPKGGMGQVVNALESAAKKAGVTIRTNAKVAKIKVENSQVTGVQLEGGEQIAATTVVSNADAKQTFINLVGGRQLDAMFSHRVKSVRAKGNVAKLHFAVKGLPKFTGLDENQLCQRLIVCPSLRYAEHAFNAAKYGEFSKNPILEITIPSLKDASMAPDGHHVVSISASFAPYQLKQGWQQGGDDFIATVLSVLEQYAPGISEQIVAKEMLSPVDIEQQYGTSGGHWHHGEIALDQLFMMRPVYGAAQYDTPVDGLFLCGATAHPGGGITGIPGHNAAKRILSMGGR